MVENSINDISGDNLSGLVQNTTKLYKIIINRGVKYFLGLVYYRTARYIHKLRVKRFRNAERTDYPDSVQFQGHQFHLHHSREGLSEALLLYGYHEPTASKLYQNILKQGEQVLDIGGNIGYYPLLASKAVGPTGRVIAIEPVPGTFAVLRQNTESLSNVEVKQVASGSTNGTQILYVSEVPNWSGFHTHSTQRVAETVEVPTQTIESLIQEFHLKPDLIRMDIEGGETQVLSSAANVLCLYGPQLFVEFHPCLVGWKAVKETLSILRKCGYNRGMMLDRLFDDAWVAPKVGEIMLTPTTLDYLIDTPPEKLPNIFHLALDRTHEKPS